MHGIYNHSQWTVERVDLLKTLWESGLSANQCAARLGNITRNAVIGKVTRLGLTGRVAPQTPRKSRAQIRRKQVRRKQVRISSCGVTEDLAPRFSQEPLPSQQETDVARISFNDIDEKEITIQLANDEVRKVKRHCKWRIPNTPPDCRALEFCGDERVPGQPYCRSHLRRSYDSVRRSPSYLPPTNKIVAFGSRSPVDLRESEEAS